MGFLNGLRPSLVETPSPVSPSPGRGRGEINKRGANAPLRHPTKGVGIEKKGLREAKPPCHIPPPLL